MNEQSRFEREYEEELLDDYQPISAIAIIALIFGLLSALAATQAFFMFLPFIAIVLSLIALIKMSASRQKMIGWTAAYIALALGIFFSISRISYERFRVYQITKDSVPIATDWLDYVSKGKIYEAHQLSQKFHDREYPGVSLMKLYNTWPRFEKGMTESDIDMAKESSTRGKFEAWRKEEPLGTIIAHAKDAEFEFVEHVDQQRIDLKEDIVVQKWKMSYMEDDKPVVLPFKMTLRRENIGFYFGAHWYIEKVYALD